MAAYEFYLKKVLLPVTPSKVTIKVGGQNKTYTLLNDGQINIPKPGKLVEITFDALLPIKEYAFANYKDGFQSPDYYIKKFKKFQDNCKPINFTISRGDSYGTSYKVLVENFNVSEEAKDGSDVTISISLKEYVEYGTKTLVIVEPVVPAAATPEQPAEVEAPREDSTAPSNGLPTSYTVVKGDTLWKIAKQYYGNGASYPKIVSANGIKNANLIYPGQTFTIPA